MATGRHHASRSRFQATVKVSASHKLAEVPRALFLLTVFPDTVLGPGLTATRPSLSGVWSPATEIARHGNEACYLAQGLMQFLDSGWSGSAQTDAAAKAGKSGAAYSTAVKTDRRLMSLERSKIFTEFLYPAATAGRPVYLRCWLLGVLP
jgi:hypothetical protein